LEDRKKPRKTKNNVFSLYVKGFTIIGIQQFGVFEAKEPENALRFT